MLERFKLNQKVSIATGLIFSFFLFFPISAMQQLADKEQIQDIKLNIEQINQQIDNDLQVLTSANTPAWNEVVVTLGNSGECKSTLINFLAEKTLLAERRYGRWEVDVLNPVPGLAVGHMGAGQTTEPHYWHDIQRGIIFYDCPGLGDPSDANDIRNAYALQKLFRTFGGVPNKRVKIMFAVSEHSLEAKAMPFQNAVHILGRFFQHDFNNLCAAMCLVITRQSNFLNAQEVRDCIEHSVLPGIRINGHLTLESESFLNALKDRAQICFFPAARNQGLFLDLQTPVGQQAHQAVHNALHNTLAIPDIGFNLAVSPSAKLFAGRVADTLSTEMEDYIRSEISIKIDHHTKREIKTRVNIHNLRSYFSELKMLMDHLNAQTSLLDFSAAMQALLDTCAIPSQAFIKRIETVQFLRVLNPDAYCPLLRWQEALNVIKRKIKSLYALPLVRIVNINHLIVEGKELVGVSDIRRAMETINAPIHGVIVQGNYFFIDEDITFPQSTYFHAHVSKQRAIGTRTIRLNGNTGVLFRQGGFDLYG